MNTTACSCGCKETHVVARRLTADGMSVALHSDGAVTGRFHALRGVPVARPRTPKAHAETMAAGWMLMREVEMYDLEEVADLYAACRWAAARGLDRGAMLVRLNASADPLVCWTATEADHRGVVVEREGTLNKMQWPGVVIVHNSRGYAVWHRTNMAATAQRSAAVLVPSGLVFQSQRDLFVHLRSIANLNAKAAS